MSKWRNHKTKTRLSCQHRASTAADELSESQLPPIPRNIARDTHRVVDARMGESKKNFKKRPVLLCSSILQDSKSVSIPDKNVLSQSHNEHRVVMMTPIIRAHTESLS